MKPSATCIRHIISYEGFRDRAYQDIGGVWTMGYGFTLGVKKGDLITPEAAVKRLEEEAAVFGEQVYALCSATTAQFELDAMTSLAYNIGINAFKKSSVLREHNRGNRGAASEAFRLWNKVKGVSILGLTLRRASEAKCYLGEEQ